ncbi:MAG: DUF4423 domain-containing protein [Myxococcales bacterium]|nr:DUF4423 domain-containing protein [Myxococcales bacterium]
MAAQDFGYFEELSSQLVRALRGRRSQRALSSRLGYSTNTLYTWEAGTAAPTAVRFFEMAAITGVSGEQVLERFFRVVPRRLIGTRVTTAEGLRAFMRELLGRTRITALAADSGLSRFAISRWLSGKGQPKLPELLCFVEHTTLRLPDLAAALVDPDELPALREEWQKLQTMRNVGYEQPMTHAVLRALETRAYREGPHREGRLAGLVGISLDQERRCLESLCDAEQIAWQGGRWVARSVEMVDFRRDARAAQALKHYWAQLAAERSREARPGLFAYHLFAVSRRDLERLEALQRDTLRQMRTIIAASEPSEVVGMLNLQLFDLSG